MGAFLFFLLELAVFVVMSLLMRKGLEHRQRQEPNYWWAAGLLQKALDFRATGPPPSPIKLRVFGILFLGLAAGAAGAWLHPHFVFREPAGRVAVLIALPLFLGWFANGGEIRWERKGKGPVFIRSSTFVALWVLLNLSARYATISALAR